MPLYTNRNRLLMVVGLLIASLALLVRRRRAESATAETWRPVEL